jgi:signal peptidase I
VISASRSRLSYRDRRSHQKKRYKFIGIILLVIAAYLLFSVFILQSWLLETVSMSPNYPVNSRFLVHPYLFRSNTGSLKYPPKRGDLIQIHPSYLKEEPVIIKIINPVIRFFTFQKVDIRSYKAENWENEYIFKRVIAIPGDTVKMDNFIAYVKSPDEKFFISEFEMSGKGYDIQVPKLPEGWEKDMFFSGSMDEVTLKDGEYFVLGDNRSASNDSSYRGPVKEKNIKGKIVFFYWPFRVFGLPE